ncbi:hypothetical protein GCM10010226_67650 [Streptomyces phaeofaciens]|uniref:Uncharacterized protein n=1 Tax=Streptomyces phaeofaciens TaxID=68254 RepID=A0A918HM55_9ACTN|nr:hypothetical protein GCM10010226_67650 [Streptomyces phaeofaciens]
MWSTVVAVVVLSMGGPALGRGQGESTPRTVSATAAASAGAAAPSAGCGKAPALTSGPHTIQSGGKNRNFILRIPDGYDRNRAYRLVFGFHWLGGTSTDVATGRTVERAPGPITGSSDWRTTAPSSSHPKASTTDGPTPAGRTSPSSTT